MKLPADLESRVQQRTDDLLQDHAALDALGLSVGDLFLAYQIIRKTVWAAICDEVTHE